MKQTTLGHLEKTRHCARYFLKPPALDRSMRRGLKQSSGVRMERVFKDLPGGRLFHHFPCVHDDQPLGASDHCKIMETRMAVQVPEHQVQDPGSATRILGPGWFAIITLCLMPPPIW
jgi:hypothetical protein